MESTAHPMCKHFPSGKSDLEMEHEKTILEQINIRDIGCYYLCVIGREEIKTVSICSNIVGGGGEDNIASSRNS